MSIVTLALAKEFLQIGHTRQDNIVQLLIDGAEEFLAGHLGVKLESEDFEENLPLSGGPLDNASALVLNLNQGVNGGDDYLRPSNKPVIEVASVTDRFASDQEYTFTQTGDLIAWTDENGVSMGRWPQGVGRFTVSYTAGYETVPARIKDVVLRLVKRAYDARGGETSMSAGGASQAWGNLLDSDMIKLVKDLSRRPKVGF